MEANQPSRNDPQYYDSFGIENIHFLMNFLMAFNPPRSHLRNSQDQPNHNDIDLKYHSATQFNAKMESIF